MKLYNYYMSFVCSKLGTISYFDCRVTLKHKLTEKSIDDIKDEAMSKYNYEQVVLINAILLDE